MGVNICGNESGSGGVYTRMFSGSSNALNLFCSSSPNVPPLAVFLFIVNLGKGDNAIPDDRDIPYHALIESSIDIIFVS